MAPISVFLKELSLAFSGFGQQVFEGSPVVLCLRETGFSELPSFRGSRRGPQGLAFLLV